MVKSGKRLRSKAGNIQDIGVTKQYLTEEDLRIERELKGIIHKHHPEHTFFAEEEHSDFIDADDVWVVDPISGTHVFLRGLPHYGIVVSHVHQRKTQFAAVYDPSMDNLYTAYRGRGAFSNNQKITVKEPAPDKPALLFDLSTVLQDDEDAKRLFRTLSKYELYRIPSSHAVNDCLVASGKYNGVVCLAKDSFPYFASSLIVQEAGGVFTNIEGSSDISPDDRIFLGGDKQTYTLLKRELELWKAMVGRQ